MINKTDINERNCPSNGEKSYTQNDFGRWKTVTMGPIGIDREGNYIYYRTAVEEYAIKRKPGGEKQ